MEEPVTIYNKSGRKLYGIVHIPEGKGNRERKSGVNLLNPGVKYRVAPNRLNVKLAREICENGYFVLRFDPSGIGDSEGELPDRVLIKDIWESIQTGLFVEDTLCANDYLCEHYEIERLIMAGSCGGAITALLAGAEERRLEKLILVDVPVNLRTAKTTFADMAVRGGRKADWLFSEYVKRLFSIDSWMRFVTLKTDFRALSKVVSMKVAKMVGRRAGGVGIPSEIDRLCAEKELNRGFFDSFERVIGKGKPILFLLAGNDPGIEVFQHYFQGVYLEKIREGSNQNRLYEIYVIENANHVYSLKEWQDDLIEKIMSWLPPIR